MNSQQNSNPYSSVGKQQEWNPPDSKHQQEQTVNSIEEIDSMQSLDPMDNIVQSQKIQLQQSQRSQFQVSQRSQRQIPAPVLEMQVRSEIFQPRLLSDRSKPQSIEPQLQRQIPLIKTQSEMYRNEAQLLKAPSSIKPQSKRVEKIEDFDTPNQVIILNTQQDQSERALQPKNIIFFQPEEEQAIKNSSINSHPSSTIKPLHNHISDISKSQVRSSESLDLSTNNRVQGRKKIKIYSFFYDTIKDTSTIFPKMRKQNPVVLFLSETFIPIIICFVIIFAITEIQKSVNAYCYTDDGVCSCNNFGTKVWSFFRQMILFKLAQIMYRAEIINQLVMTSNYCSHKKPYMEISILYILTIILDIILVIWIEHNEDWLFFALVTAVGFVVFANTFRLKHWLITLRQGLGYIFYDIIFLILFILAYWVVPNLIKKFKYNYGYSNGLEYFMYLYPFIDLVFETIIDTLLNQTQFGELYVYQAYLMLIGVRIGVLLQVGCDLFEFWFNLFVLSFFRINNASMFCTILLRRFFYYELPVWMRPLTAMDESAKAVKGKHGAFYEHLIWILFYYYFQYNNTVLAYYLKYITIIEDCKFEVNTWDAITQYKYQPVIIWFGMILTEYLGYYFNKKKHYDNIKWLGGTGYNFIENVIIRCFGWYMFLFGLLSILASNEISDVNL